MEKLLSKYKVSADWVSGEVEIKKIPEEFVPIYFLKLPEIETGTKALLEKVRENLIAQIPMKPAEMMDITSLENLKKKIFELGMEMLRKELPNVSEDVRKYLIGLLIHEMVGLGRIEMLLADGELEEIVLNNASEPVWVYHKKFGWVKTNVVFQSESEILNYAASIGRRVGRQITVLNPLMDAHLITGDRVNATLFPISTKGNTITIRKFRRKPWTITELIENRTISSEVAALLWLAIQYELNMIVSGGTASGKTTFLNALLSFIPPNHRVISIEDSVSGEEEVIIKLNGKLRRVKIKELFNDKECNEIHPSDWEILSLSKDGKVEFKKVKKLMRHFSNKPLYKILTYSGREIMVTGDHSLFSLNNDLEITPIKVAELKVNDYLAVPRKLPLEEKLTQINLLENLNSEGLFVKGETLREFLESKEGRKFLIYSVPTNLRSKRRIYRRKGMLPLKLFKELVKKYEWGKEKLENLFLFEAKGSTIIPLLFPLDRDFCFMVGCWIGDGCYDKQSVLISISDEEVFKRLNNLATKYGFNIRKHSDGFTLMLNSTLLKEVMLSLDLKGDSHSRRIPEWVYSLPKQLKAELLKGIFSAEGWVNKNEVALVFYSANLIHDIQTLLLNFGIIFRVKKYKDKMGKEYFEGRISSVKFLDEFYKKISFEQLSKARRLGEVVRKKSKDVSDIIPLPKHLYSELKYICRDGMKISYKGWKSWHRNYRTSNIGREYLRKIILQTPNSLKVKNPIDMGKLFNLTINDVFWDRIKSIEKIENSGYLYDFSVEDNENFICNNIFAHNTRELQLPQFLHWIPLTTREPNPEGKGEVTMLDLLVNSLRMRPDRIVVGEIRRQREAEVLFEAMHTGHSVYATLHADTAEQTYRRMINPPINIPESMLESLHLITVCFRDRRKGIRRVYQVAELIPGAREGEGLRTNVLFRWKPSTDEIVKQAESYRLMDELRLHTGMSQKEVLKDLEEKKKILEWMVKQKVNTVNGVGMVVAEYYSNPEIVLKIAKKNESPRKIIPEKFLEG